MPIPTLLPLAEKVLDACRAKELMVATAESCTGGLVAALLTSVAGSSHVVDRGFVTYTNQAKTDLVGVPADLFPKVGAVSEEVARAMAEGAVAHSLAQIGVGITGIAGPGGGTADKPVGLVHIAVARKGKTTRHERRVFPGDRQAVRQASAQRALEMILDVADQP